MELNKIEVVPAETSARDIVLVAPVAETEANVTANKRREDRPGKGKGQGRGQGKGQGKKVKGEDVKVMETFQDWINSCGAIGLTDKSIILQVMGKRGTLAKGRGIGVFAGRDFAAGDLLFSVPAACIMSCATSDVTLATKLQRLTTGTADESLVTAELIVWLQMVREKKDSTAPLFRYFNSKAMRLTPPTPDHWDGEHLSKLETTNVHSAVQKSLATAAQQVGLLVRLSVDPTMVPCERALLSSISLDDLLWAKGMYLSRRYPSKYASVRPEERTAMTALALPQEHNGEYGPFGTMVPLLDLLNHDDSCEWTTLSLDPTCGDLLVKTAVPRAKGEEIFMNYGDLSNEVLLRAYGFAKWKNQHDKVTVRMTVKNDRDEILMDHSHHLVDGGLPTVSDALWASICSMINHNGDASDPSTPRDDRSMSCLFDLVKSKLVRHRKQMLINKTDDRWFPMRILKQARSANKAAGKKGAGNPQLVADMARMAAIKAYMCNQGRILRQLKRDLMVALGIQRPGETGAGSGSDVDEEQEEHDGSDEEDGVMVESEVVVEE